MYAAQRNRPSPIGDARPVVRFSSAEEAWFWFMRTEKARAEKAKAAQGDAVYDRPCLPDDVYAIVSRLHRAHELCDLHLEVMGEYGFLDRPPFPDVDEEAVDWIIWLDAFDVLEPLLIDRGIVE
ncbi:MAG: hypothetical protein KAH11_03335 [Rhodospirillales bacterium]|nr:hypothetical protein [Rhodospirillales bacterium]